MVWHDPATERVLHLACQVARADVPVLITGPNGTGKERIAEIIQANSPVRDGPFVVLNCGALPAELIEAELFGADAGAYTGASKAREGKFEAADGGTLFLDEIGNLPLAGQMKLLRVLETGRFERLGSNRERQVKVRVISATNADLRRDDPRRHLPRRPVLPPQRDRTAPAAAGARARATSCRWRGTSWPPARRCTRRSEAALLAPRLARQCARTEKRDAARQPAGARRYRHGGRPGPAGSERTGARARARSRSPTAPRIVAALARAGGVVAQAAAELGLSRQALYRRMERLGIARP